MGQCGLHVAYKYQRHEGGARLDLRTSCTAFITLGDLPRATKYLLSTAYRFYHTYPDLRELSTIQAMATEESSKISHPGTGWHMLWPTGGITNIQLDVVGFLAILGEDAVKKTSRLASLSSLFLLPRLIPAPHSLLYSERPEELDVLRAKVVGVHSGNLKDHLSHVGSAVLFVSQLLCWLRTNVL